MVSLGSGTRGPHWVFPGLDFFHSAKRLGTWGPWTGLGSKSPKETEPIVFPGFFIILGGWGLSGYHVGPPVATIFPLLLVGRAEEVTDLNLFLPSDVFESLSGSTSSSFSARRNHAT